MSEHQLLVQPKAKFLWLDRTDRRRRQVYLLWREKVWFSQTTPNPTEDDAGVWQALRINEKVHMTQLLLFAIEIMVVKDTSFLCRFSHALLRTPDEFGVFGLREHRRRTASDGGCPIRGGGGRDLTFGFWYQPSKCYGSKRRITSIVTPPISLIFKVNKINIDL